MAVVDVLAEKEIKNAEIPGPATGSPLQGKDDVVTMSSSYSSMAAFREDQPKLFYAMTKGISQNIIIQLQRSHQRLLQRMKESRQNY